MVLCQTQIQNIFDLLLNHSGQAVFFKDAATDENHSIKIHKIKKKLIQSQSNKSTSHRRDPVRIGKVSYIDFVES